MVRVIGRLVLVKSAFVEISGIGRSADAPCSEETSGTSIIDLCGKATLTITQPGSASD